MGADLLEEQGVPPSITIRVELHGGKTRVLFDQKLKLLQIIDALESKARRYTKPHPATSWREAAGQFRPEWWQSRTWRRLKAEIMNGAFDHVPWSPKAY